MNYLKLNLKYINSLKINVLEGCLLEIIRNNDVENFKEFKQSVKVPLLAKSLEKKTYIKILNTKNELSSYASRLKLDNWEKDESSFQINQPPQVSDNESQIEDKVDEILNYVNKLWKSKNSIGRGYSLKAESNRKAIRGRLKEGYSVYELKEMVMFKFDQWKNSEMINYFRPYTLFEAQRNFNDYIVKSAGYAKKKLKNSGSSGISNFSSK